MDERYTAKPLKKRIDERGAPGLTEDEVRRAREKYGENRLSRKKRKGLLQRFLESFGDPMIKVLLIALAINVIFLFHHSSWFESAGIAVAILLATVVSTLSEYGSESAFERLQEEASRINCRVQRARGLIQIPVDEIVVGDIVLLQTGDKVPADGVMIKGNLEVDQSALNGESKEAVKFPKGAVSDKDDFLNPSLVFSGTVVCAGEGLMRVAQVGDATFYGRIGAEIQEETRESPLRLRLGALAKSIGKFGYIAALFSALAYLFNIIVLDNKFNMELIINAVTSWERMFPLILKAATIAVTVIVMAVPEGLPMMITVVLSANMKRMLKDNVLVRKLVGIETAGSMNILFTDKTGTLTRGKLDVTHVITGSGRAWTKKEFNAAQIKLREILHDSVYYNCAASMNRGVAIGGNATDRAAIAFVSQWEIARRNIRKTVSIPFSSEAKFMATTVTGDRMATLIKGAPEKLLPQCTHYYDENGAILPLTSKSKINNTLRELSEQAVRLIAVAVSDSEIDASTPENGIFKNLKLVGLLGLRDEIRPDAVKGLRQVQGAGIQTVMITGDARPTALAIAREMGLVTGKDDLILTSDEMRELSDETLSDMLPNLRVVARALPSDKSRLVRIAQAGELVVGMTGDGVNDAPALKQADIGFSLGSGTEVAKEAGDIVILDDNFSSISKAICYGRTIFKSIQKFIIYQLSICMCAVGVTVVGPLVGVDFPITVIQMLWINIVMDTLAGLAFSGEKARIKYMYEPPKPRNEPILGGDMVKQIGINSAYCAGLCLYFLKSPYIQSIFSAHSDTYKLTAFFALFMFLAIFSSFCARTPRVNLLDYLAANKPFLWIMGLVTAVQVLIIYFGGPVFRTVRLELSDLILVVMLAFTIIPVDMIRKIVTGKIVHKDAKKLGRYRHS